MNLPLIIAHRGASALAPENTLAAFRRAIADGAEGIEFDVRLTKDGVPVVFHDAKLKRIVGCDSRVVELTAAELQRFDAGSWFNRAFPEKANAVFTNEIVPTLAEVLDFLADFKGLIYIELKGKDAEIPALVRAVCRQIKNSALLPQIIVKSFKLASIPEIRLFCPQATTAALFAPKIMNILRKEKYLLKIAKSLGADQVSVHYSLATRHLTEKAAALNLPVTIWTTDHPRWIRRARKLCLRAVITNDPAKLLTRRKEFILKKQI